MSRAFAAVWMPVGMRKAAAMAGFGRERRCVGVAFGCAWASDYRTMVRIGPPAEAALAEARDKRVARESFLSEVFKEFGAAHREQRPQTFVAGMVTRTMLDAAMFPAHVVTMVDGLFTAGQWFVAGPRDPAFVLNPAGAVVAVVMPMQGSV